ncbi:MAG: hypothetical protein ABJB85_07380 [Nitrososphaerota archaeon]
MTYHSLFRLVIVISPVLLVPTKAINIKGNDDSGDSGGVKENNQKSKNSLC